MSTFYSTNLKSSSDNLVLLLDSTNTKSYPGNGITWFDLSGSGNHATMYGSVPLTTDVVSCWDFSGVTSPTGYSSAASLGFTFSAPINYPTNSYTFEAWVKNPPASIGQCGLCSNAGSGDGFRFGIAQAGIYYLCGPTYTEGGINYVTSYDNSKWHHIVAVFDRRGIYNGSPSIFLYKDGVYEASASLPASQTAQGTGITGLVRVATGNPLYTGKLAKFCVYSTALTANQILSNYNATKGRYGR